MSLSAVVRSVKLHVFSVWFCRNCFWLAMSWKPPVHRYRDILSNIFATALHYCIRLGKRKKLGGNEWSWRGSACCCVWSCSETENPLSVVVGTTFKLLLSPTPEMQLSSHSESVFHQKHTIATGGELRKFKSCHSSHRPEHKSFNRIRQVVPDNVRKANMHQHTKFHQYQSNDFRDIAIFFDFQDGNRPPS